MARAVAILLSIAAGIISIIGLASIFSGAYYEVVAITSLLEAAKVITAVWLRLFWNEMPKHIKKYLVIAVVVLMGITSLGIYGFFARAHIKQQVAIENNETSKIAAIEARIKIQKDKIADFDKQTEQLDTALNTMATKGRARDAKSAITEANKQRETRNQFLKSKADELEVLGKLEEEKAVIDAKIKEFEVEVGPLKYLAALFYENPSKEQLEHAVRILIMTLIFVFDPLAIALLVASNYLIKPKEVLVENKSNKKRMSVLDLSDM